MAITQSEYSRQRSLILNRRWRAHVRLTSLLAANDPAQHGSEITSLVSAINDDDTSLKWLEFGLCSSNWSAAEWAAYRPIEEIEAHDNE